MASNPPASNPPASKPPASKPPASKPPASKPPSTDARTQQGRELARQLYEMKISQLEKLDQESKTALLKQYPLLGSRELEDVRKQVIDARLYEQERVGWQAIPHDLAVLAFVAVTGLFDLRLGVVVGVAALVLLESLFQFYFNRRTYRLLSWLVWLTYPAYIWLAYILYRRDFDWLWIGAAVLMVWGGSFILGMIARIPPRLMLEQSARKKRSGGT
jgi:hypothetical protein